MSQGEQEVLNMAEEQEAVLQDADNGEQGIFASYATSFFLCCCFLLLGAQLGKKKRGRGRGGEAANYCKKMKPEQRVAQNKGVLQFTLECSDIPVSM